jgi:hypothetical protein
MAKTKTKRKPAKPAGSVRASARARDRFIRRLAESGNVADSLRRAGIVQRTAYKWRKTDVEFRALWEEAIDIAADGLVDEARRRAVDGVTEPIFQQGRRVGEIKRYSDRMLEILLKGHRPQYRENQTTAVQVNVGQLPPPTDRDALLLETARGMAMVLEDADRVATRRAEQSLLPAPAEQVSAAVKGVGGGDAVPTPTSTHDAGQANDADARRIEEEQEDADVALSRQAETSEMQGRRPRQSSTIGGQPLTARGRLIHGYSGPKGPRWKR